MACCAVILFAVPNRGLENASLMAMVKGQPNEDLVRTLSGSSPFARRLHEQFFGLFRHNGTKIISIFETLHTPTVEVSYFVYTLCGLRDTNSVIVVPGRRGLEKDWASNHDGSADFCYLCRLK